MIAIILICKTEVLKFWIPLVHVLLCVKRLQRSTLSFVRLETENQDKASNNDNPGPTFCIFVLFVWILQRSTTAPSSGYTSTCTKLHVAFHHVFSKMVGVTLSLSCRVDGFNAMGLHRSVQIRHDGGALCAAFVFPL